MKAEVLPVRETFFVDATLNDLRNAYFKAGIYGEQGSGKTHTAVNLAIAIAKVLGKDAIAFYDTEVAATFHTERVKKAGLKFYLTPAKSLVGAIDFIYECERLGIPGVIDSVTHLWRELIASYCKQKGIKAPVMRDWGHLKPHWYEFSDAFVQSRTHLIACGRAGIVTEDTENDEGKVDGFKVIDTKMKAEGEFGYEASLELEMERVRLDPKKRKEIAKTLPKKKHVYLTRADANVCIVKKDRNPDLKTTMMGRQIYWPIFEDFDDHMKCLNFGGKYPERSPNDSSAKLFQSENGPNMEQWKRKKDAALSKLWDEVIVLAKLDGTGKDQKLARAQALVRAFGTAAEKEIEDMRLVELLRGIECLQREFKLPPFDMNGNGPSGAEIDESNVNMDKIEGTPG